MSQARLLAVREDGQGRYFQFLGYTPRRYRAWAVVCEIGTVRARLVLPEWHPRRTVVLPLRLLPSRARIEGAWLELSADLSVCAPGQLNIDCHTVRDPPACVLQIPVVGIDKKLAIADRISSSS
jgi:hypothetical protein